MTIAVILLLLTITSVRGQKTENKESTTAMRIEKDQFFGLPFMNDMLKDLGAPPRKKQKPKKTVPKIKEPVVEPPSVEESASVEEPQSVEDPVSFDEPASVDESASAEEPINETSAGKAKKDGSNKMVLTTIFTSELNGALQTLTTREMRPDEVQKTMSKLVGSGVKIIQDELKMKFASFFKNFLYHSKK